MTTDTKKAVSEIVAAKGKDRTRLMDVLRAVQSRLGSVSDEAIEAIAREMNLPRVDVEGVATFYHFFTPNRRGRVTVYLSTCPACRGENGLAVERAFEKQLGIRVGEVSQDGAIGLRHTSCIGLCDQGPAALAGTVPLTQIQPAKVAAIVKTLREKGDPVFLVEKPGDGANASELVRSMVVNHLRETGAVVFAPFEPGAAQKRALAMKPEEVIAEVKKSRLRGRGGAGFPTGMKWEFARKAEGSRKFLLCNADEGEPGTFKDRVILTENPDLLFEGMTIAGYAIGAEEGILYLRAEYDYLRRHLEAVLNRRREKGLLGKLGDGFAFDIRIQMGAGAYVCGEESALISSCEGLRGAPKDRPPFPVEKGFLGLPTSVNNVETLCAAARVLEKGADWFGAIGTKDSTGSKAFSVSGDCDKPGVYEIPFGITVQGLLDKVGASGTQAVLVGGPSGSFIGPAGFGRKLCFEDLATGGSIMVFGKSRDLIQTAREFMEFFVEESCGWCVPCRVGNVLILRTLEKILAGNALAADLDYLEKLCQTVKKMSRCGLGQTSPNPALTTLQNFRDLYLARLSKDAEPGLMPSFDLRVALADAVEAQGRQPVLHEE